jgi:hypothetical protein
LTAPDRLAADIVGISVWGPGLEGWAASRDVLAGRTPYEPRPSPPPPPSILSANERRRTGPVVRLALVVAQEAAEMSGLPPDSLQNVFASSSGDGVVVGSILDALTKPGNQERVVSPTQFHNSVHNAAAGYWSIATGSRQPATCLGCHDATFAAGLLKAMAEVACDRRPVLLCVYDHPLPPPMDAKRPIGVPFAIGLVLAPRGTGTAMARISVRYATGRAAFAPPIAAGLQELPGQNAVANALRLLEAIARGQADEHSLAYLDAALDVSVTP